jgi:transcriptional regulator with XRE-family HTH domain
MTYLRHIREQRGLSQDKLSELSGVPQNTISLVERGVRTPHNGTLRKLAQVLKVDNPSWLVMPTTPITTFGELIAGTPDERRGYLEFLRMQGTLGGFVNRLEDIFSKSLENSENDEWVRLQVAFLFGYARGAQEEASKDKQS